MTKAFATMVVQMAFDTKVMSASNNTVYKKTLPIAGETSRRFATKWDSDERGTARASGRPPLLAISLGRPFENRLKPC